MQSRTRALKRGVVWGMKHRTTKNRKGQQRRMQTIVLHRVASDANQVCHKTIIHDKTAIKNRLF